MLNRLAVPACLLIATLFCCSIVMASDGIPETQVPPVDASDPSELEGYQIRPLSATVRASHSINLEIKFCFPYTPEGGSSYTECNTNHLPNNYELFPLLLPFSSSMWSVNGIEGGNDVVGRIRAEGNKATYIAPAKAPNPATVSVSAEIATKDKGKLMVNAEITVVESVIHASVRFSGKREEHGEIIDYAGVAELDFVRADLFSGGIRYDCNARSPHTWVRIDTWNTRSDTLTCRLKGPVTRLNRDTPFSGNFFIYSDLNSYVLSTLFEMVGIVECRDGDSTYLEEVNAPVMLTTSKGPPDPGFQPIVQGGLFRGKSTLTMPLDEDDEGRVDQTMEWTAKKD